MVDTPCRSARGSAYLFVMAPTGTTTHAASVVPFRTTVRRPVLRCRMLWGARRPPTLGWQHESDDGRPGCLRHVPLRRGHPVAAGIGVRGGGRPLRRTGGLRGRAAVVA